MSEKARKAAGSVLLIISAVLLSAGCLPIRTRKEYPYSGRGVREISVSRIPHLDPDSITNTGNADTLSKLPGIGPSIAESLIREREANGFFRYPEDLTAVNGIGEKKLEQIRPLLTTVCGEREE